MIQSGTVTNSKLPQLKIQNFFDIKLSNGIKKTKASSVAPHGNIPTMEITSPISPDIWTPTFGNVTLPTPGDTSALLPPRISPRASFGSVDSLATTNMGVAAFEVTITFFLPLMRDIKQKVEKITRRCQVAEHHRRVCSALLDRALIADDAVKFFETKQQEEEDFWRSKHNFLCVQRLGEIIDHIEEFIRNVSQLRRYRRFVKRNNVQCTFEQLASAIDTVLSELNVITPNADQFQMGQDLKVVEEDVNEMMKFLQEIRGGITDASGQVSREIEEIYAFNAMFRTKKPLPPGLTHSAKIDPTSIERFNPPVQPSMNVEKAIWRNREVALTRIKRKFKDEDEIGKNKIRNNVAILKKLEASFNIILFHGVIEEWDESKQLKSLFVVTEWADLGNLREYYKNAGPLSWTKKLSLAVDVARAMNFLRAVDILHHDLTPESILITGDHQAQVSGCGVNFFPSDSRQNSSDRISDMVDKYRYMAPEKLKGDFPYDVKCEIYSFGMLLLEIAEENIPLHGYNYNTVIEALRENTYRPQELFTRTKMAPKDYRDLVLLAINYDRNRRPPFSEIFLKLNAMLKRCKTAQAFSATGLSQLDSPISPGSYEVVFISDNKAVLKKVEEPEQAEEMQESTYQDGAEFENFDPLGLCKRVEYLNVKPVQEYHRMEQVVEFQKSESFLAKLNPEFPKNEDIKEFPIMEPAQQSQGVEIDIIDPVKGYQSMEKVEEIQKIQHAIKFQGVEFLHLEPIEQHQQIELVEEFPEVQRLVSSIERVKEGDEIENFEIHNIKAVKENQRVEKVIGLQSFVEQPKEPLKGEQESFYEPIYSQEPLKIQKKLK
ncbi:hypothetical protein G9A89_023040 [Geosiphon pyriformis]|nr:hypothetical protein G9A89_023040 [Geosiphon pyriformis]